MKRFLTLLTGTALLAATPAIAQDAAPAVEAEAGMKVVGPNGGDVGTVESVNGDVVVVATDKNKAALPISAFAKTETGLSITLTQADLDAAVEKAAADAQAALLASMTAGTEVKSETGAAVIGTIKEADTEFVTIERKGKPMKLPLNAFRANENGVALLMTEAELEEAVAAAQ